MSRTVLHDIELALEPGEIACLTGKTGAGKSSLLQVMCGITRPSAGEITLEGKPAGRSRERQRLREAVGILMQSSEMQLFAETVERDVAFGPRNQGLSAQEALARACETLRAVGLDPEEYARRSPFSLSEGEMRRVALAGVLAMRPAYLLLDEPSSGLDGPGREILYQILVTLRDEGKGILMVTHEWDEVEELADRVFVMAEGRILAGGAKEEVLADRDVLAEAGLRPPPLVELLCDLKERGLDIPAYCASAEDAARHIGLALRRMRP